jgi:hypothetical protein
VDRGGKVKSNQPIAAVHISSAWRDPGEAKDSAEEVAILGSPCRGLAIVMDISLRRWQARDREKTIVDFA